MFAAISSDRQTCKTNGGSLLSLVVTKSDACYQLQMGVQDSEGLGSNSA